ncbi:N-acetylglucosamine-6-sulfatase-like isoform X2 [Acanthaster planci]|uniref:N-acetylglucosamine-6-sulfatase-like isoform X2 n=1 Tax=Acanthaster planci TaxID=133434 RepID=A0A8B7ZVI4_ACAPL|nr:N-acetylglucosamine-6-sulfatase-like isoform X2 [Acanthaster planci]
MDHLWRICVVMSLVITVYGNGKRPNIVFILTDDQDVTMNGMTPLVNTVSLIGKQGITFNNMFVSSPLCCPSRSSIFTGNYVHNHKTLNNSISGGCSNKNWQSGPERSTFATYLKGMGYSTFFAGKYLNQYGTKLAGGVSHIPPGWDEWNGLVKNSKYYNYTLSVNGKAEQHGDDYHHDYLTDLINNRSHEFLEKQSESTPPFFVMVSTPACHAPFDSAPQYVQNFTKNAAPRGPSFNKAGKDKHWLIRHAPNPMAKSSVTILDDVFRKRWRTLLSVDDMVKNIVDTLDSKKLLDSTYIIFTSDNGYHLGQFSLPMDKRQLYEFDIRVPLLVRGPKIKAGTVTDHIAVNIDIMPTIVHLAGDPAPQNVDGISLVPILIPNITESDEDKRDCLTKNKEENTVEDCPNTDPHTSPAGSRDFLIEHSGEWLPHGDFGCKNTDLCAQCYPDCVCEDSRNNTYSCLRHIDTKSNYEYCELKDEESFQEYYDLNKDPHQLTNTIKSVKPPDLAAMHKLLVLLQLCKGDNCRQLIPPHTRH